MKSIDRPFVCAILGAACSLSCGVTLDAGENVDENAPAYLPPPASNYGSDPPHYWNLDPPSHELRDNCESVIPGQFEGAWNGEFASYSMPSGSSAVRLVVEYTTFSGICGKITFGKGTPPPLPTDPAAPYPPNPDGGAVDAFSGAATPLEGFPYQVMDSLPDGEISRLRANISLQQPWKAWCDIQYSYPRYVESNGYPEYSCLPPHRSFDVTEDGCTVDDVPTSCMQVNLCVLAPVCTCSTDGCTMDRNSARSYTPTNLRFDGDTVTGTIPLLDGAHSFTLTREH